jgi:1-acyl-sn-glycerol-3-phosphate acyltransferase
MAPFPSFHRCPGWLDRQPAASTCVSSRRTQEIGRKRSALGGARQLSLGCRHLRAGECRPIAIAVPAGAGTDAARLVACSARRHPTRSVIMLSPPLRPASPPPLAPATPLPSSYVAPSATSTLRVQPRPIEPYEEQIEFPLGWCGRIGLFVIDLVLVPLRILSLLFFLSLLSLLCRLYLLGTQQTNTVADRGFGPKRTWLIRNTVRLLGTPISWAFGLTHTSVRKHAGARLDRATIYVANHVGYVEIILLVAAYAPSVVAKKEIASYPLCGTIARALQCIFVDRRDPNDRVRVREMMRARGHNGEGRFPPLLIFPEGTTGNGLTLLKMQKGVFSVGVPVQPFVLRTHFLYFNPGWCQGDMGKHVLGLLTRLYHQVSIQELPLYSPQEAEKEDAILYAENVAQTMANALLQPVSTKTMFDNPELQATIKKRHAAAAAAAAAAGNATGATTAGDQRISSTTADATPAHSADRPSANMLVSIPINLEPQQQLDKDQQPPSARRQGWAAQQSERQETNIIAPTPATAASNLYAIDVQDQRPAHSDAEHFDHHQMHQPQMVMASA